MQDEQRFDEIWLGGVEGQYYGCGIIVGHRHILTCNHVVRECLGMHREATHDLKERQVKARTRSGVINLEVVASRPLPPPGKQGQHMFDDLCLLVRRDDLLFADSAVARLQRKEDCKVGEDEFKGQGLGQDESSGNYVAVPFSGTLFDRIGMLEWHHVSSTFHHLEFQPGCSGAASVSKRCPDAVLGMMQGGLIDQVGVLIPAWHLAAFLTEAGLPPLWHDPDKPLMVERRSPFKALRKATVLEVNERHLAFCDRRDQLSILNPAFDAFVKHGAFSLLVAVSGDNDDLPELFNDRFRRDSIEVYINHLKYVLARKVPKTVRERYPSIAVTLQAGDDCSSGEAVYSLLSRSTAGGKLGRLSPDPRAIAGAMSEVDAPVMVKVRGPVEILSAEVLGLWRDCITDIATRRANAPILVLFLAINPPDTSSSLESVDGLVMLPELPLVGRKDVEDWIEEVLTPNADVKWNPQKTNALNARIDSEMFSMRQLQQWVSDHAD